MQLCDLPDDVLRLALKASLKSKIKVIDTLKSNLPLLAVCQRWRRLALPIVHHSVVVQHGSEPGRDRGPAASHRHGIGIGGGESGDDGIVSNLDLVVSAGCVCTVKNVEIAVYHEVSPFPGLGAVVRLMRAAAEEWGGARRLSILVHHNGHVPNKGDVDVSDYEDDIEKTSAALAATMPRVHRVLFDRGSVVPVACELFGRLAALYGDRLQVLHSWCPIAVPPGYVFRELRGALIWHGSKGRYRHPCVDPAKLVSLTLSELPLSHSWAPFSADDASEEVEFPSLRVLGVTYSGTATRGGASAETRHSDGHPWRLNFPRLRKLNVLCTQDACPLLEYAVLPGRMEEVTIKAATLVLPRISGMSLPAARRLKIAITSAPDDDNDPAVLAAVGRILKNSPKSKYAWLEVSSSELPVLPEHIAFTPLTALEIWAPTSVDTMLQLIRRLPRLTTLALLSWTLGDIQEDISVPEPGADCLVEPLSTRLATMVLQIDHNAEPLSMFVLAVKYLLLSIPTLARLRSTWIPKEPVMEVVEAYSEQYPHLRSVVLKLGYSRS